MARKDLFLDEGGDRVVRPRAYEDSEHWERRRDHAVITLQRYWRGWLARRRAGELRRTEEEKQHVSWHILSQLGKNEWAGNVCSRLH